MLLVHRLLPALVLLALTACGGGGGATGTWKLDGAATVEANRANMEKSLEGQPEEMKKMALGMIESMFSSAEASLTLNSDGTLTGTSKMSNPMSKEVQEANMTGTWTQDGDTVTMNTREEGSDEEQTQSGTVSGAKMTVVMGSGDAQMMMVFKQ